MHSCWTRTFVLEFFCFSFHRVLPSFHSIQSRHALHDLQLFTNRALHQQTMHIFTCIDAFSQFTSRNASSFKITSTPMTPSIYPGHSCLDSTRPIFRERVDVFWVTEGSHTCTPRSTLGCRYCDCLCNCCRGRCTLWPLGLLQLHLRLVLQHFLFCWIALLLQPAAGSR